MVVHDLKCDNTTFVGFLGTIIFLGTVPFYFFEMGDGQCVKKLNRLANTVRTQTYFCRLI